MFAYCVCTLQITREPEYFQSQTVMVKLSGDGARYSHSTSYVLLSFTILTGNPENIHKNNSMYAYSYVQYICMYVCINSICTYVCTYICMHACMYVHTYVCMYSMYVCIYQQYVQNVCMYVCIVCMYVVT